MVLAKSAGAVVYPDRIEYEGQAYPLTTNTRASLDAQGGTMVAKGMAVKTTHDTREIYVLVEDPGYYLQIRAHKAQGAGATDAGAMVFNGVYNSNMKAARALVGAINNAARAVGAGGSEERFQAVARAEQSRRQADAGVKQLAEQLADEVARDRQALASLTDARTSAGKRLARILADEEAWYRRGGTETGAQTVAGCLALLLLPTAIVLAMMGLVVPAIVAAVMFLALGDYLTWWRLLAHKLSRT